MTYVQYFFMVMLPGIILLYLGYRFGEKSIPQGRNFMPTADELKALKKDILG